MSLIPTEVKISLLNYCETALRLSLGCCLRITVQEMLFRQWNTPGSGVMTCLEQVILVIAMKEDPRMMSLGFKKPYLAPGGQHVHTASMPGPIKMSTCGGS